MERESAPTRKAYDGWPLVQMTKNFLRGGYAGEMSRKLVTRMRERVLVSSFEDPLPWLEQHGEELSTFCRSISPALWEEADRESIRLEHDAIEKMRRLDLDLGGAGNFPLLYFLVRQMKPQTVVETGVAAGFSSQAILTALKRNGSGRLYSSDLPYFRIEDPEKYIGFVVDDDLKADWTLLKRGDRANLPEILYSVDKIDIFHYDSDKSYRGREWVVELVLPRIRKGGAFIMDDLNDNCHFEHFVRATGTRARVFKFWGKYVGLFFVE